MDQQTSADGAARIAQLVDEENAQLDAIRLGPQRQSMLWRIPIVSLFVVTIIMLCQILDTTGLLPNDSIAAGHAFLNPWFNCGGFLLHSLPNALLFLAFGIPIEFLLGSLNKGVIWLLGYQFSVAFTYLKNGGRFSAPYFAGNGSSIPWSTTPSLAAGVPYSWQSL